MKNFQVPDEDLLDDINMPLFRKSRDVLEALEEKFKDPKIKSLYQSLVFKNAFILKEFAEKANTQARNRDHSLQLTTSSAVCSDDFLNLAKDPEVLEKDAVVVLAEDNDMCELIIVEKDKISRIQFNGGDSDVVWTDDSQNAARNPMKNLELEQRCQYLA